MGIKACKNQNCSYEYNLIENDSSDSLTTFDKKVFIEFKELRREIENANNSRINKQIGVFALSDPNKLFKRFVKWYKIGYTDPLSKKLKNRLSVKKLRNFLDNTKKKSQIDNISRINPTKNEMIIKKSIDENSIINKENEKIYENHYFNFNESLISPKRKSEKQILEISICQGNRNDINLTNLKLERKQVSPEVVIDNKEKIKCNFETEICYNYMETKEPNNENFILNENMNIGKNNLKKELTKKSSNKHGSKLNKKTKTKSKSNLNHNLNNNHKFNYEKEFLISFSLIRETELSISKSSSYDENNRDSSKFVHNNLYIFSIKNTDYFKECVVKGLPTSFRWKIWMICANINYSTILESNFYSYYEMPIDEITDKQIQKDINRTYTSDKIEFLTTTINKKESLFKILKAFASNDKELGYCQGMNFIVGLILEVSDFNEVEAFYLMQSLFSNTFSNHLGIRGFFINGFPLLHFYLYVFDEVFKIELSSLYNHFKKMCLPNECWVTKWFLSLFTICMPIDVTVRIWDCIFINGLNFIIKFSISLLEFIEEELIDAKDEFEIMDIFNLLKTKEKTYNDKNLSIDLEELIKKALKLEIKNIDKYKLDFENKSNISLNKLDVKYDIKSSITYSLNTSLSITNTTNLTITDLIHEQHNSSESSKSNSQNHKSCVNLKENFSSPFKKSIFGFSNNENICETFDFYKMNGNNNRNMIENKSEIYKNTKNNEKSSFICKNDEEEKETVNIKKRKIKTTSNCGLRSDDIYILTENGSIISNNNNEDLMESVNINTNINKACMNTMNEEKFNLNTNSSNFNNKKLLRDRSNNKSNNKIMGETYHNNNNQINENYAYPKTENKRSTKKRNLLSCFEIVNNKSSLEFSSPNKKIESSFLLKNNNNSHIKEDAYNYATSSNKMNSFYFNRSSIKLKTVFSTKPLHTSTLDLNNKENNGIFIFSEKDINSKFNSNFNKCHLSSNLYNIDKERISIKNSDFNSNSNKNLNIDCNENRKNVSFGKSRIISKDPIGKNDKTLKFTDDENCVDEEFDDEDENAENLLAIKDKGKKNC